MSCWPPKLKLRRTEEAPLGIRSSRGCECFFTLTTATCHVSEAPQAPPVNHRGHKLSPCEAHDVSVQHSLCLSKQLLTSYSSLCFSQNLMLTQVFISVVMHELDILCLFGSQIVWYEIAPLLLLGSSQVTFCSRPGHCFLCTPVTGLVATRFVQQAAGEEGQHCRGNTALLVLDREAEMIVVECGGKPFNGSIPGRSPHHGPVCAACLCHMAPTWERGRGLLH